MSACESVTAPEKPKFGDACNGCGYCCAAEVCRLGRHFYGESQAAPCPSLEFSDGRFWCGIVREGSEFTDYGPALKIVMGIGVGCDSDDPPTLSPAPDRRVTT